MYRKNHYKGDPRRIIAHFSNTCHTCGKTIRKGEEIIYWPNGKHAGHLSCDEADFRRSVASFEDEDQYYQEWERGYNYF